MTVRDDNSDLNGLIRWSAQLFAASAQATVLCDPSGEILMANPAYLALIGQPEDRVLGVRFTDVVGRRDADESVTAFERAAAGTPARFLITTESQPGVPFTAEIEMTPVREGDAVVAVLASARDTSDITVTERENKEGLGLLRIAGTMARFGGWSVDAQTGKLQLSREARLMLGLPAEGEIPFETAWALHPPQWQAVMGPALDQCVRNGKSFDLESEMRTVDGDVIRVRTLGEAERDADGLIQRARGAVWDITETARERDRRERVENQLQVTLNTLSDGLIFLDAEGRFTFINDHGAAMLQSSADELIGSPVLEAFPDARDTPFIESLRRTMHERIRTVTRAPYEPLDATFEATMYPSEDGVAVYLRDVTEDEAARQQLVQSTRRITEQAALLDAARDAMVVRDLDHRIVYWNRAAAELYGWPADDVIGTSIRDLLYDDPSAFDLATQTTLDEGFWIGEIEQRSRSGRLVLCECRWQLLYDETGAPRGIFAVNSDITDLKRAEDARMRAQRMESLGTLAGGIAHDLNNVLTPILMAVQLLEHGEDDPARREILATMEGAVKRGADMIRQVLSFARGVEGKRIRVDIDRLLHDVVAFTRDTMPDTITLETDFDASVPSTMGDPTQLLQILTNLVANARDAMEGTTGTVRIMCRTQELTDRYSSVSHLAMPGRYVVIEVEDTGHGMPAELIEKIFEPFFTTKEVGRGTGLGLATSLAIVRSHGGWMQVYSEPGNGTRFRVGLPVDDAAVPPSTGVPAAPRDLPQGSNELVLIVDDEATIRQITSQTLEANGYRTLQAANGREAIDLIESGDYDVDVVLTDMMMPVMDGAATSAYLEEHFPELPVIAASGLNSNGGVARAVGMGVSRFLPKPYTTSLLLTTIRDTLLERSVEGLVIE